MIIPATPSPHLEQNSWYELVNGDVLRQGDLLHDCPVFLPPKDYVLGSEQANPDELTTPIIYNVVVLNQSCDLENKKLQHVLVAPFWPMSESVALIPGHIREDPALVLKFWEQVRRGYQWPLHMLNMCELTGFETEIQVVDFRQLFTTSHNLARQIAGSSENRLRVKSPYREHLAQALAKFFMRVGLPSDIEAFAKLP